MADAKDASMDISIALAIVMLNSAAQRYTQWPPTAPEKNKFHCTPMDVTNEVYSSSQRFRN